MARGKRKQESTARAVYQQIPMLYAIGKTRNNGRLRRQILDLSPNTVKAFASIADNILSGNVPLSKKQSALVKKNEKSMRGLAKASMASKKKLLQRGSFFNIISKILPAVIGAITGMASR